MQHSTDRILTTHVGNLPRPRPLREVMKSRFNGQAVDEGAYSDHARA